MRAVALAATLSLAFGSQAQAKWLRAETQRFVLYSDGGERGLREYAALLEDFDIVLRHYHHVDQRTAPPRKLVIYLVRDNNQLQRAADGAGSRVVGFYSAGLDDIFAVAVASRTAADAGGARVKHSVQVRYDTLFHEYTHHFVSQYETFPYPGWMVEGLAEYFGQTEIGADKVTVGGVAEGRGYTLMNSWMPVDKLLTTQGVPDTWAEFYAQSWILTHYMLMNPERRQQLDRYKQAISEGTGSIEAMKMATGMTPEQLSDALRVYMRSPLSEMVHERKKLADIPVTITELPPSADDLLLENQKQMNRLSEEEQAPLLARIRERAAKYPGDRLAQITLARAEVFYGDRAAGERLLEAFLQVQPTDAEALRLMARSRILTAEDMTDHAAAAKMMASARPFLAKANEAEIDNYQTYYDFARTRIFDAGYPNDNTVELLTLAHQIAPQVDDITFRTAQALVLRKDFAGARPMLQSLANDPHGGELADAAKTLLRQIAGKAN